MTPDQLTDWLDRLNTLMEEMITNCDKESMMVASILCFLRGAIASCAEGDNQPLMIVSSIALSTAKKVIEDHKRLNNEIPS